MILTAKAKGLLLGLLATLFWASSYPAARLIFGSAAQDCDPFALSLIKFSCAAFFFLPFIFSSKTRRKQIPRLIRKEWKTLLFLGFSGVVIQGVLVFVSMKYTTAARASLMANTSPIFTVIAAWLYLHEKITRSMFTGMSIGFAGILLALVSRNSDIFSGMNSLSLLGDILALLSGAAWAAYTVGGVNISRKYDPICVTFFTFVIGAVCMPVGMFCYPGTFSFAALPLRLWLGMIYLGIFSSGVAFACWLLALKFVSSSMLGAYGYLSALLAALLAILLLHEQLSLLFIFSALLALGGMYLMMRK